MGMQWINRFREPLMLDKPIRASFIKMESLELSLALELQSSSPS